MKDKSLLFIVSLLIFGSLLVVFLKSKSQLKREELGPVKETVSGPSPTVPILPTKTEEEKEIIRNIETHEVRVTTAGFEPVSLTIKSHDQVEWVNETGEAYKLKGEDWGGVEIRAGRRFTQAFEKEGSYPYSCELHPEMTGEVIVE